MVKRPNGHTFKFDLFRALDFEIIKMIADIYVHHIGHLFGGESHN